MEKCYICHKLLEQHHIVYNRMCPECGEENLKNREFIQDLSGYLAIVTGGRIKIGYCTALKLLRAGAAVIVTTRFPYYALKEYSKEIDFTQWKDRLTICELDLKRLGDIDLFINYVKEKFGKLDILINNAAQTVKKSRDYYVLLEQKEADYKLSLTSEERNLGVELICSPKEVTQRQNQSILNVEETESYNSWIAKPEDISLYELLEVQIINSTAPFLLCTKLKECFCQSSHKNKFIINVSSLEGSFSQKRKSDRHIHTNMAKASLNMITKSLGASWAKEHIFVYSVDPGWISNQYPQNWNGVCNKNFNAPLDCEDAAARILYTIFQYYQLEKVPEYGVLYKDYKRQEW